MKVSHIIEFLYKVYLLRIVLKYDRCSAVVTIPRMRGEHGLATDSIKEVFFPLS